ncbi:MAG TPA: S1 family peptidase, partial [Kofleriaceae bacterium]|nr:S1 family peptidase [Kofleriaceae bacterium]
MWRKTMHLAVLLACSPTAVSTTHQAIVGGSVDTTHTSVVAVTIEGGRCSGVVVASRVVMTAAHCALPGAERPNAGTVDFADVVPSTTTANIIDLWIDRDYDPSSGLHDIALLRIDRDAPAIAPLNTDIIPQTSAVLVGYGESTPGVPETYGTRSEITLQVAADMTGLRLVAFGGPGQATCTGDSGGAAFNDVFVVGVIVSGTDQCDGLINVDLAVDKDINTVIQAWSGPCPADGVCDSTCQLLDPDCDPCRFEGTCVRTCPHVDLDCPIDGLPGETCVENAECESRVCTPAPEGADRGSFCSSACT